MHNNQASKELSYSSEMLDFAFVIWNRGMFQYDKNSSDLVLKKGFKFACDVPKRVSNVVKASSIKVKKYMCEIYFENIRSVFFYFSYIFKL